MNYKFIYLGIILITYFTSCIKDKGILSSIFYEETPCSENDTIGVWQFVGLDEERVRSIAIHPQKPHVVFVGTGRDFSAGIEGKLFYSSDCGKTWNDILSGGSWAQILYDPHNSKIIYATPHQLIKSTDGGMTWHDISAGMKLDWETRVQTIAVDPKRPKIIFAGTGGFFGGTLYKSPDGGKSWYDLSQGDMLRDGVVSLAIDPVNTDIIYAGCAGRGRLYKSIDGGKNWIITGLGDTNYLIHDITIHPVNPNIVLVGFMGFSKSLDGGNTWTPFNRGLPDSAQGIKLIIDPISHGYYSVVNKGISGGIYKREEAGSQWEIFGIEGLLMGSYYTALALTPDGTFLYFGPQEKGLYKMRLR